MALIQSLAATLGSLYFSEIKHFAPCSLCWFQRIFMYPLVIILAVGILRRDEKVGFYALPTASLGWLIAFYQNLLYYGFLAQGFTLCENGISCTAQYPLGPGFLSIPLLSLLAFTAIIFCLVLYHSTILRQSPEKNPS